MGRVQRKRSGTAVNKAKKPPVGHTNTADIDPNAEGFCRDEVDEFHSQREKVLLDKSARDLSPDSEDDLSEREDEVMGLDLSSSDEDVQSDNGSEDQCSDGDEEDESDDVIEGSFPTEISAKAWGKSKKAFYSTDYIDYDVGGLSEGEGQEAELEEEEAMALQQRMAATLSEQDFETPDTSTRQATDDPQSEQLPVTGDQIGHEEQVIQDLSQLSRSEKLALLEKDSPEIFEFLEDFQLKFSELKEAVLPLVRAAKTQSELFTSEGVEYLQTKLHLNLCYCLNIMFYLRLKSCKTQVHSHPVIKQIVQIRQLISQMKEVDQRIEPQIKATLESISNLDENQTSGEMPHNTETSKPSRNLGSSGFNKDDGGGSKRKAVKTAEPQASILVEEDPLDYYERVRATKRARRHAMSEGGEGVERGGREEDEETEDGKRAITYQIARNKGLTPKRRKEQRNPRVRHRRKFKKAVIKRKSQVLPVVTEMTKYGGEATGIRSNLSRSVRIK